MTMLTASELAQLRADILATLPDTCVIQRASAGTSTYYFANEGTASAVGTVACRLDPFNQMDSAGMVAGREANRATWRLTLAYDADISDGDQVVVNGHTFQVMQLHDVHSDHAVRRALLVKAAPS